jgi:predicted nucleotidyltransferase component of viral defense system
MIAKQDILDRVTEWRLRPDVIEKDYVLGWVLAAIAAHPTAGTSWVFKGGTCLKKCFFETYRFSEDLDFTLAPESPYDAAVLRQVLLKVVAAAHDMSGNEFPEDLVEVRERKDKQGRTTFQGKIGYRGPLLSPFYPRITFDLTCHEPIQMPPTSRAIFHPYPDELPPEAAVTTYQFEELFAEKVRALVERTRPRDLYDIVFILENRAGETDLESVRDVYERKCATKGLAAARADEIVALAAQAGELRSEWENMLAHQLPALPPLDSVLSRLRPLLWWIDRLAPAPAPALVSVAGESGSELVAPLGVRLWGGSSQIEVIRFAGASRLLVEFTYHERHRVVEPYSLRRARTGNLLLYAWEQGAEQIKAFKVAEIHDAVATNTPFNPRYVVELAAGGALNIRPTASRAGWGRASARPARPSGWYTQRYVFQCPHCMKEFRHAKNDPRLRRHNNSLGSACPGRRGHLLRTE